MCFIIFSVYVCCGFQVRGQDTAVSIFLTRSQLNRVVSNAFGSIVTSFVNNGAIGTYASLDPANAAFSLKGTIPTFPRFKRGANTIEDKINHDTVYFSYLSFALSGNLIDKSYAKLFTGGSLNAGINASAIYNFTFGRPHFKFDSRKWAEIGRQRDMLISQYSSQWLEADRSFSDSTFFYNLDIAQKTLFADQAKLARKKAARDLFSQQFDAAATPSPALADSIVLAENNISVLLSALKKDQKALDSMHISRAHDLYLLSQQKEEDMEKKFLKDYDSLTLKANFMTFSIFWYSLSGGIGTNNYNSFNPNMPFDSQISKNSLTTWHGGLTLNYLHLDYMKKHTLYANLSVSYLRTNNLSSLTAVELDQTKKTVNAGGDTTRQITSKINVYTDPVTGYLASNLTGNFYYLFGKTPSGIHLSPSINFQDNGLNIANATLGYILAIKNTVKDQPILNSEVTLTFNDIFQQQLPKSVFWKRLNLGISFTVPINIFYNYN